MWEDLAEIRTVAVDPACRGRKIGHRIVDRRCSTRPASWACARVFVLTFETRVLRLVRLRPRSTARRCRTAVYEQLLRSYDEGVAEFLDLERVKPNTLGNTRMLLHL